MAALIVFLLNLVASLFKPKSQLEAENAALEATTDCAPAVPTVSFNLLYVLVIVRLARRELVWIDVTAHPTRNGSRSKLLKHSTWNGAPRYLVRDRDGIYGAAVTRRLRAMGIRDKPIAPGSPWQNGVAERLIGTIRRECVDHVVAFGEQHLRQVLKSYATNYYNTSRTHCSLDKDAPI
jgi:transposase InsO family protein